MLQTVSETWKHAAQRSLGTCKECCFIPRTQGPKAGFRIRGVNEVPSGWGPGPPQVERPLLREQSRREQGARRRQGSATAWLCDLRQFSALSGPGVSICKMDMALSLEVMGG